MTGSSLEKQAEQRPAFDIFNGDADGIIALHQLRLAQPRPEATLISGVKRDNKLLLRLCQQYPPAQLASAAITVLDISLDTNKAALPLLPADCELLYIDHHFAGDIPQKTSWSFHIDHSPDCCTSLIVNRLLDYRFTPWAVCAAFGDNLHEAAYRTAREAGLSEAQIAVLCELGELINYNAYGNGIIDLHCHPVTLYKELHRYPDPFELHRSSALIARIRDGYEEDQRQADSLAPWREYPQGWIFSLPDEPWARRISGVLANRIIRQQPERALALLVDKGDGNFMVSVRSPIGEKDKSADKPITGAGEGEASATASSIPQTKSAEQLCRAFPSGGGRAAAAGINALPAANREQFAQAFASWCEG